MIRPGRNARADPEMRSLLSERRTSIDRPLGASVTNHSRTSGTRGRARQAVPHEFLVVSGGPTALKESGDTPTIRAVGTKNIGTNFVLSVSRFLFSPSATARRDEDHSILLHVGAKFGLEGSKMRKDDRDLLEVLKLELEYLTTTHRYSREDPQSPRAILRESPACFNYGCFDYDCREHLSACTDCVLIKLVPLERRSEAFPCQYIPLDKSGEGLDSLYRYCGQQEVEKRVRDWLQATITQLEEQRNTNLALVTSSSGHALEPSAK
jgi:hypothetical protein